jgi:hypothetical protein
MPLSRAERRRARKLQTLIMSWPKVSEQDLQSPELHGRVVHQVVQHDDWCKTLNGGSGGDCNCSPVVSFHLQPRDLSTVNQS